VGDWDGYVEYFRNDGSDTSIFFGNFGNVGIGTTTPAALLTVGSGDKFQVDSSGNLSTYGNITGLPTQSNGSTTATGAQNNVTSLVVASTTNFDVGNLIFVDNAGTDYWSRITAVPDGTHLTLEPAVSADASAPVTEYTTPSIGSLANIQNRFDTGYFLNGVVTGSGTTTYGPGLIATTSGDLVLNPAGNVGIGTTEPDSKLTINTVSGETPFQIGQRFESFPTVAAVNGGYDGTGTSHTVNLPSGIASGDLLLVFFNSESNPTITFPDGWYNLFQASYSTNVTFGAWYRIADGTEGSTITVTTSTSQSTDHTSYRITSYSGTPTVGTAVTGIGTTPNPPSLTPSWGAKDILWFAAVGYWGSFNISAYPTNYTNGRKDGLNLCLGTARRELNAASEDPGTFTLTGSALWVANTVAIAPASVPPTTTFVIDASGNVGIGTTTPAKKLEVLRADSEAQFRISQSGSVYAEFQVAATSGDLTVTLDPGEDITLAGTGSSTGANLWVCEGTACPSFTLDGDGSLFVEGYAYFAGDKMKYPSELGRPKRTIILTASGAITPDTSGAAQTKNDGTNFTYYTLDFDSTADESAYWEFVVPDSFDSGTNCNVYIHWTASAGTVGHGVSWKVATLGRTEDEVLDDSVVNEVEIEDALIATGDLMITAAGSLNDDWNPGEFAAIKIYRDIDGYTGDNLAADARLLQVKIEYSVTQESD